MPRTVARRNLSPAERRDRESKVRLVIASVMVAALVLAAGGLFLLARNWNPPLSDADLCPVDRPPTEEIIIVLDATDPWNPIEKAVIRQEFAALLTAIPRHARVALYTLDSEFSGVPVPALRLCNPGNASDYRDFPLIGPRGVVVVANPELIERRWTVGFAAKLDSILGEQARSAGSERSPLLEMIRGAAIEVFGGHTRENVSGRKLYLFSDLLQNSELYSLYRDPNWTASTGRALGDLSTAGTSALAGVEVYVFLLDRELPRRAAGQNRSGLIAFWDAYLSAQGATLAKVRRIER